MELISVYISDYGTLEGSVDLYPEIVKDKHAIGREKSIRCSTNGVKSRVAFTDKIAIFSVLHR